MAKLDRLHTMDDDGRKIEKHTRYSARMFLELLAHQKTIEQRLGIRMSGRLNRPWLDRPCIGSTGSSNVWPENVLVSESAEWSAVSSKNGIHFLIHQLSDTSSQDQDIYV